MAHTYRLALLGVSCAGCVRSIEKALAQVPEITKVQINLADRTALIDSSGAVEPIISAIRSAGYDARQLSGNAEQERQSQQQNDRQHQRRRFLQSLAALLPGAALMLWAWFGGAMTVTDTTSQLSWAAIGLFIALLMLVTGGHFYKGAVSATRHGQANMDSLVALGTGAAWLYSMTVVLAPQWFPEAARHLYFEASLMILGLINLGQALETRARGKTADALHQLFDLQVKTAQVVRGEKTTAVSIEGIEPGDMIRVRGGEKIAVDGIICNGDGLVDESMLTGEPLAQSKGQGDTVHAGTLLQKGTLLVKTSNAGDSTLLAQIIEQVRQAQSAKPQIGQLADRIAGIFVPSVLLIATLTALCWYLFGPPPVLSHTLIAATSVLIIACPCALGLATPMSIMVGVGKAAQAGVLIRNGDALQTLTHIDTLVLDKTGTLTEGQPRVTDVEQAEQAHDVAALVNALEAGSQHPLASALLQWAEQTPPATLNNITEHSGQGMIGDYQGQEIRLGNRTLHPDSITLPDPGDTSSTYVYLSLGEHWLATFTISDPIKADTQQAIRALQQKGLKLVVLSGDRDQAVQQLASTLGIDEAKGGLLPNDKAAYIKQLQANGQRVAMAGDGINDAPALAVADVGMAMGSGTDIAMATADLTLMRGSLAVLDDAIAIARATLANIRQNLFGAFIYNTLGIPLAAGVLYPFTGWLLSPVIAGAAMALSSVTVVSNANRLRRLPIGQHRDT